MDDTEKCSLEGALGNRGALGGCSDQGETNMHQIVVTVSCRLCPLFPEGELAVVPVPENALFLWEVILFLQNLLYESTVFPHREFGGKK